MPDPSDSNPPPLEYRDRADDIDRGSRSQTVGAAFGATFGFAAILLASVFMAALASEAVSAWLAGLIPLAVIAGAVAIAVRVRRTRPAVGAGLFIGIGLAVLVVGSCFGQLLRY